jgi:hypothetical protein
LKHGETEGTEIHGAYDQSLSFVFLHVSLSSFSLPLPLFTSALKSPFFLKGLNCGSHYDDR